MFLSEVSFLDNILINKRKKYRGSNRMEDERGERQKGRESIISPTHSLDIVHIVPWTLLYCLYTLRISIFSSFSGNGTGQPQQMPGKGVKQTFKPRVSRFSGFPLVQSERCDTGDRTGICQSGPDSSVFGVHVVVKRFKLRGLPFEFHSGSSYFI